MWCCFKSSRTVDPFEDDDEELARGIQESWNQQESPPRSQQEKKEEETRGPRELEEAQVAEALKESLKEEEKRKQREAEQVKKDVQVKKDEQMAKVLQNMVESPPRTRTLKSIPRRASLDVVDEQLNKALKESVMEEVKRKQLEEQAKKEEQIAKDRQNSVSSAQFTRAVIESLKDKGKRKQFEDEQVKKNEPIAKDKESEHFAKAVEKSLMEKGKGKQSEDEVELDENLSEMTPHSICGGCNFEIEHAKSVDISGVLWHPECLQCDACHKSIAIHEVKKHVSNARGKYHKSCYVRVCYICKEKKMREYHEHHFWKERYCPSHESDGTPKCCSCERLEPRGTNYVLLSDGRWLCLECMDSSVMDSYECQPLHFEIREYFEGLNMKIEKEFPFLLVEKDALNKAEKEEKIDYRYETVTRGICLSEAQTVKSVSKRPTMGPNKQLIGMDTEIQKVGSDCEVTAILILFGLPRLLTGYILAHEMMHAYLRLNKHRKLNEVHEEGICQVLGHMWLESQRYAPIDPAVAEASASASSHTLPPTASKKGDQTEFERRLVEFCLNQIETDESRVYGGGFRKVNKMVTDSSLQETLKEIIRRG